MRHEYITKGVCAKKIVFDLDGNVVRNVSFFGGCNGNLQAVSRLTDGMTVEEIEAKCKGICCGSRQTSCADQLAKGVREALNGSI
ncbi:MAG: TIGR03905 family TSCPD domain-containing protein [Christensenellaceae bacterium]|jgi:uncharacterized protein (TIGR03905 family)|nr:TIGR03905 family TSCPD domain-containing protein [Christensenellaceae bacterium]